jgi:phosphoribosyl-ATP pyrophosphohydrolase
MTDPLFDAISKFADTCKLPKDIYAIAGKSCEEHREFLEAVDSHDPEQIIKEACDVIVVAARAMISQGVTDITAAVLSKVAETAARPKYRAMADKQV